MRIAITSDTHLPSGQRALPARLVQECRAADLIIHAGDFTDAAVLAQLELAGPVTAVYGNCDDDTLTRTLPARRIVEAGGVRIGVVHDSGGSPRRGERLARQFPDCGIVVFGHSHQPLIERHGALLLINPGSPTDRRRAPVCTMAVVRITDATVNAELIDLP
jgi:uncharacterized protein